MTDTASPTKAESPEPELKARPDDLIREAPLDIPANDTEPEPAPELIESGQKNDSASQEQPKPPISDATNQQEPELHARPDDLIRELPDLPEVQEEIQPTDQEAVKQEPESQPRHEVDKEPETDLNSSDTVNFFKQTPPKDVVYPPMIPMVTHAAVYEADMQGQSSHESQLYPPSAPQDLIATGEPTAEYVQDPSAPVLYPPTEPHTLLGGSNGNQLTRASFQSAPNMFELVPPFDQPPNMYNPNDISNSTSSSATSNNTPSNNLSATSYDYFPTQQQTGLHLSDPTASNPNVGNLTNSGYQELQNTQHGYEYPWYFNNNPDPHANTPPAGNTVEWGVLPNGSSMNSSTNSGYSGPTAADLIMPRDNNNRNQNSGYPSAPNMAYSYSGRSDYAPNPLTMSQQIRVDATGQHLFHDMFHRVDKNDSGEITWGEFVEYFGDDVLDEKELRDLFVTMDTHQTGTISLEELVQFFRSGLAPFIPLFESIASIHANMSRVLTACFEQYPTVHPFNQFKTRVFLREFLFQLNALHSPIRSTVDHLESTFHSHRAGAVRHLKQQQQQSSTSSPNTRRRGGVETGELNRLQEQINRLADVVNDLADTKADLTFQAQNLNEKLSEEAAHVVVSRTCEVARDEVDSFFELTKSFINALQGTPGLKNVYVRKTKNNEFVIYEVWQNREALSVHNHSQQFRQFQKNIIEYLEEPMNTNVIDLPVSWWKRTGY